MHLLSLCLLESSWSSRVDPPHSPSLAPPLPRLHGNGPAFGSPNLSHSHPPNVTLMRPCLRSFVPQPFPTSPTTSLPRCRSTPLFPTRPTFLFYSRTVIPLHSIPSHPPTPLLQDDTPDFGSPNLSPCRPFESSGAQTSSHSFPPAPPPPSSYPPHSVVFLHCHPP